MKFFTNKNVIQKLIVALVIVILFNFLVPVRSQANFGGDLLKELVKLIVALGDVVTGAFNHFMLGTTKMYGSAIINVESDVFNENIKTEGSSLYYVEDDPNGVYITFPEGYEFDAGIISRRFRRYITST